MEEQNKLSKYRECFNQSQLFSTEMSSKSNLQNNSSSGSKHLVKIESKFTDDPLNYYKKVKERFKEAGNIHASALKNKLRAKSQLQRVQKDAQICRHQFIRMYMAKKFKLEERSILQDHQIDKQHYFRASVEKFKRKKVLTDLSRSMKKEEKQRYREELLDKRKSEERKFRETFRVSDDRIRQRIAECHHRISKERQIFNQKKRNLMELGETKSKFHYLLKVNEQMKKIKDFQDKLQEMEVDSNPQQEERGQSFLPNVFATTFKDNFY